MIGLLSSTVALGARAAAPPAIAVVDRDGAPVARRIAAELSALGFRVISVADDAEQPSRMHLEEVARSSGAVAAVRVAPSSKGIEVWLVDRVTGKTVLREVLARDAATAGTDAVVAVRTVELLRASLLEIDLPHPSRGDVLPSAALRRAARLPPPAGADVRAHSGQASDSVWFGAASGSSISPGGLGASPAFVLGAYWQPAGRLSAGIVSFLPVVPARLTSVEGTSDVYTTLLGAGVRVDLMDRGGTWVPDVGTGISMLMFHMDGTGKPPAYQGRSDMVVTAAPYAELGLSCRLLRDLSLRSEMRAAIAMPEPVIRFAGRDVARMGRPLVLFLLGFEYRWRR
jgi:hypothetical protein